MYNVAIIGAGPAGIFSALEIVKLRPEWKVVLIEKGQKIEKRKCPLREGADKCTNCRRCGLLCGWGGAGAFSDGKLTLTPDVAGDDTSYQIITNNYTNIKEGSNVYDGAASTFSFNKLRYPPLSMLYSLITMNSSPPIRAQKFSENTFFSSFANVFIT